MSSCCGGNCGCGAGCKCDSGCGGGGCKMYPDMSYSEKTTTETPVSGVADDKARSEVGAEMSHGAENGGCKCNPCHCDPCNCK